MSKLKNRYHIFPVFSRKVKITPVFHDFNQTGAKKRCVWVNDKKDRPCFQKDRFRLPCRTLLKNKAIANQAVRGPEGENNNSIINAQPKKMHFCSTKKATEEKGFFFALFLPCTL